MALFGKKQKGKEEVLAVFPEEIYRAGELALKDVLSPSALEINPTFVRLGSKLARTFFVFSYPRYLHTGWFSPIINLDKIFDISMFIHPVDTAAILKTLRRKVAQVQSQISMREEKGLLRDPILDTAYRDLEELRDKLQQAQERLFYFGLYITVYGLSEEELTRAETDIKSTLEARLVYTKPALFQQAEGFETVLPLNQDKLGINTYLNSSPISSSFPFVSFDLTSNKGVLYGINRHNSGLILFDRFSLPNANSVIFGTSGAGKSYLVKLEVLRSLMWGIDVIVIDPEREYEYLAQAVAGSVVNISLTPKSRINPLDLPTPRQVDSPADVLRSNIGNPIGLFRLMLGGLSPEEDAMLDQAISETYALRGILPGKDVSPITPPPPPDP